jgi:hypothetical protein
MAAVMLVSIEAAIDGCVKADGGIVAAFLTELLAVSPHGAILGRGNDKPKGR